MSKDVGVFLGTSILLLLLIFIPIFIGMKKSSKLNIKQKNWWLISHIFFVVMFIGGMLGTTLLAISTNFITEREHIYAHLFIEFFDWFLIIPGGIGSFFTGVWLAIRTHWGVTKYYWIIAKLGVTSIAILFGSMYMRIWIHETVGDIIVNPIYPLKNPEYLFNRENVIYWYHNLVCLYNIFSNNFLLKTVGEN